jgi:hypothetical protein
MSRWEDYVRRVAVDEVDETATLHQRIVDGFGDL